MSWLVTQTPTICLSFCCHCKYWPQMWLTKCYTFPFFFLFSGKNESLVFCVGPRLYWCPYAVTGLHSQGWSIRSLQLTSDDCRHHLWHGTMLACPRMHHNITKERVEGPCNYLVKPGSCWLHKSVWKNFSLHAGLEKQLLLGWNSMISSQGLCLDTHTHTRTHTTHRLSYWISSLGGTSQSCCPDSPAEALVSSFHSLWALGGLSAELSLLKQI